MFTLFNKKPSIVILHGWGLSGARFEPLVHQLTKLGYTVYAPDLPGFGTSAMPSTPWGLKNYTEFLREFITDKKIKNPIIIGHSFGGRIALKYQLLFPKSTRALILTGTPGFTPVARRKIVLFTMLAKVGKVVVSLLPFPEFAQSIRRWYYYVAGAKDYFRAEGIMRDIFKMIVTEELVTSMLAVDCPCLLLWGQDDSIVPTTIAVKMEHIIDRATLNVIPMADHGLPYKMPEVFAKETDQFIRSL